MVLRCFGLVAKIIQKDAPIFTRSLGSKVSEVLIYSSTKVFGARLTSSSMEILSTNPFAMLTFASRSWANYNTCYKNIYVYTHYYTFQDPLASTVNGGFVGLCWFQARNSTRESLK